MPIRQVVSNTNNREVNVDALSSDRLYGIQHGKNSRKKYKLHLNPDGVYEAIGFLNSTGHLNEAEGFDSLQDAHTYCANKGHTMYEFDSAADFAEWL